MNNVIQLNDRRPSQGNPNNLYKAIEVLTDLANGGSVDLVDLQHIKDFCNDMMWDHMVDDEAQAEIDAGLAAYEAEPWNVMDMDEYQKTGIWKPEYTKEEWEAIPDDQKPW